MSRMGDEQARYAELVLITRPRLLPSVYATLRETQETMEATAGCRQDKLEATGLGLLLDMYDKLGAFHDAS